MTGQRCIPGFAALVAAIILIIAEADFGGVVINHSSAQFRNVAFVRNSPSWVFLRGGSADVLGEEEEYDDEYDYEEEEDEKEAKLAASAIKATQKARAKKTAKAKEAVNVKLSKKKKSNKSILKLLRVPYIIRASLNPFTLIAMTKGYFGSLFNLDYLKENKDESQELRSALEEKAKKSGPSGGRRGKRSMRPGQAKTLSDLPQLNT